MVINQKISAHLYLLLAAAIWGSSYIFAKEALGVISSNWLLAIRYSVGFVVLCLVFGKRLKLLSPKIFLLGLRAGTFCYLYNFLIIWGLQFSTPMKNSFLNGTTCLFVPLILWIITQKRPETKKFVAGAICLVGTGLAVLTEDLKLLSGDFYMLLGMFVYGIYIIDASSTIQEKKGDAIALTIVHMGMATLLSLIFALIFEDIPSGLGTGNIWNLLYQGIICVGLAFVCQNLGQKYTDPSVASLLISTTVIFGTVFSAIFYKEILTLSTIIGFVLIMFAILVSEFPSKKFYCKRDTVKRA